jgi:phosphatidylinositol-3-phosphatase
MENLSEPGALATPSIASLSRQYAISTAYYAVSHPSLPNYLALVSGSTWGTSSDCTDCYVEGANLASQLKSAGISWGAYFEGMPGPCFTGPESGGTYAKKHDPFVYFDDVRADTELCSHVQPFSSLTPLLSQDASAVPRLVWVTPDLCNDGHDCPASVAGQWLSRFVSEVTASAAWRQGGVLFVTWDEGTDDSGVDPSTGAVTSSGGGGHVLTIVVAPGVPRGTEVSGAFDHYSLLRTVEDALGLPLLGEAGAPGVHPMTAFWSG